MSDVAHAGRTVLFVSHNMAAMRALCTRAILLERGRVAIDGAIEPAIKRYLEQAHTASETAEWKYLWKNPLAKVVADDVEMLVNGTVMRSVQAGDRCTFRIHYHTTAPEYVGSRYSPEIRLYADGQKVLSMAPHIRHGAGIAAEERGSIDCTIERWPFRTRNMHLELLPWVGPEVQEHVMECLTFSSYDGDFHGSGVVPQNDDGFMFVEQTWSTAHDASNAPPRDSALLGAGA
jgi:lipopolysaccharide transport system ATP-binding protein